MVAETAASGLEVVAVNMMMSKPISAPNEIVN